MERSNSCFFHEEVIFVSLNETFNFQVHWVVKRKLFSEIINVPQPRRQNEILKTKFPLKDDQSRQMGKK